MYNVCCCYLESWRDEGRRNAPVILNIKNSIDITDIVVVVAAVAVVVVVVPTTTTTTTTTATVLIIRG